MAKVDIQVQNCSDIGPESTPEALDQRVRRQAARGSQPWPREGPGRDPKFPKLSKMGAGIGAPLFEWEHEVGPH